MFTIKFRAINFLHNGQAKQMNKQENWQIIPYSL